MFKYFQAYWLEREKGSKYRSVIQSTYHSRQTPQVSSAFEVDAKSTFLDSQTTKKLPQLLFSALFNTYQLQTTKSEQQKICFCDQLF
jgi:hypothetical protein